MKILLHLGQGKTGTTALQQSLHASADALRSRGICYPRFGGNAIAHHLLLPLCGDPRKLPKWTLNDYGGPEAAVQKANAAWAATCDDLRSNPPDLLILSSELLLAGTDRDAKLRLREALSPLSTDIVPIIYVRHPVALYRSILQELLKAESRPRPPVCQHLRETIVDTEAAFPHPPVLVAYDRTTLFHGDIVKDFAERFLAPWLEDLTLPPSQANPGLSAEALVLMAQMRVETGNTVEAARKVARLKGRLLDFDRQYPPKSPIALLPKVAEAALRSATCHRWLAETGRLQIPGLDVSRIDDAEVPDWMLTALPETMFPHDPQRLADLRQRIEQQGAGAKRTLRLQDRLLRFLNRKITAFAEKAAVPSPTGRQNGNPAPETDCEGAPPALHSASDKP